VRKGLNDEIKKLKRQLSSKGDFQSATAMKSLSKVRSDLRLAEAKLKGNEEIIKKWGTLPPGVIVIDQAL
jgi:hypothetical protein